jgi:hypothetical protein
MSGVSFSGSSWKKAYRYRVIPRLLRLWSGFTDDFVNLVCLPVCAILSTTFSEIPQLSNEQAFLQRMARLPLVQSVYLINSAAASRGRKTSP